MQLKSVPEDFIVEEINTLHFNQEGKFSYYQLKKRDLESGSAIQQIADRWKINQKYINVAGNKDKIAVTTQFLSISQGPEQNMKSDNLELTYLGKGKAPLQLGHLEGNKFTIIARKITSEEKKNFLQHVKEVKKILFFVNYYDDQRFGNSKNNHIIGKYLVRKQFKEACALITATTHYPQVLAKEHLEKHSSDFIGALRCLPKKVILMYVHAYQSFLWNETAKLLIQKKTKKYKSREYSAGMLFYPLQTQKKLENTRIPLIGFDIEETDAAVEKILQQIMKQEQITSRDFLPKQMPELLTAGGSRDLLMECKDFSFKELEADVVEVKFTLGKGSYATMVVKQLFG